jgi:FMN-dependent oxidoreductase (nitrilotriacetate monooxygenase family)
MSKTPRQITMVAFMQAQNCSNYVGSWRHPSSSNDFLTAAYFQRMARVLEEGKFHVAFFDDRLAMPDRYKNDHVESVEGGVRVVKLDVVTIMMVMGLASSKLGIGGTGSTTYFEPFHIARAWGTVDHMIGGRAAWNVVTSVNDGEALNFGREEHLEHDLRYDRADEFMEVVLGHWDTWEDDALIVDKGGRFADGHKVHRLDHAGKFFKSRGPFTVPRTPQGRPVVIQAGQSGRGKRFAARWGELVFASYRNLEVAKASYKELKDAIASEGRDPDKVVVAPACYAIVGETRGIAEEKFALADSLAQPIDTLALLSEAINFDFGSKAMDEPFSDAELAALSGMHGMRDRVIQSSGKRNPTVRDFVEHSGRGRIREQPVFKGNPKDVADQMEAWFTERGCDGFVMSATHLPGAYEDFVRLVVPELQRRGLYHKDYRGTTLRENLGLERAEVGDWRKP